MEPSTEREREETRLYGEHPLLPSAQEAYRRTPRGDQTARVHYAQRIVDLGGAHPDGADRERRHRRRAHRLSTIASSASSIHAALLPLIVPVVIAMITFAQNKRDQAMNKAEAACQSTPAHITVAYDKQYLVYPCGEARIQHRVSYGSKATASEPDEDNASDEYLKAAKRAREACSPAEARITVADSEDYLVYTCGDSRLQSQLEYSAAN